MHLCLSFCFIYAVMLSVAVYYISLFRGCSQNKPKPFYLPYACTAHWPDFQKNLRISFPGSKVRCFFANKKPSLSSVPALPILLSLVSLIYSKMTIRIIPPIIGLPFISLQVASRASRGNRHQFNSIYP